MNTEKKNFEIVSGPSKDAIFDACKYAYNKWSNISVDFKVAIGYTRPADDPGSAYIPMKIANVRITGVEHEDGSGESFIIKGYCDADLRSVLNVWDTQYKSYHFTAYYNTKNRKGNIEIFSPGQ